MADKRIKQCCYCEYCRFDPVKLDYACIHGKKLSLDIGCKIDWCKKFLWRMK